LTGRADNNVMTLFVSKIEYIDRTHIKIKLEGNTPEALQIDTKVFFSFDGILLQHRVNANEASGFVDFIDRATLSLSSYTFNEQRGVANQGKIANIIELFIDGDSFNSEATAIANGYFQLNGLPPGLTASFGVGIPGDNRINIELSGAAISHNVENNLKDISLRINPLAFSSTLNAFNDKGESSNIINNISINFLEDAKITSNNLSFFEHSRNDGSIRNKITFTIEGGAKLKQINKTFKYGFEIHLANAKKDGFIKIGDRIFDDYDTSDTLQVIGERLSRSINAGGIGSFINGETIYAKSVGSALLLLKNTTNSIKIDSRTDSFNVTPSPNFSIRDKTISVNDPTLNINDNVSFKAGIFSGLIPNFTPINNTQIEMELTGNALSHTKADSDIGLRIEFSSGIFDNPPATFDNRVQLVNVNFIDTSSLTVTGKFKERNTNIGEIDNLTDKVTI
jgi:hypothetical protein